MFNGKVVLLTCASSKIGEVIAVQFAKLGANLALSSKKENNLKKVALQCEKVGRNKPLTIIGELTNESDIQNILESTVQQFRKLDVLINNADVLETGSIEDTTLDQFDRVFNTNVRSVYHLTMLAVPHLIKTKGNIVNVSVNGNKPCAGVLAYNMSKSGLDQFTCSTALELATKLVRVNSVNPTFLVSGIDEYDSLVKELYDNFDFVKGSYNISESEKLKKIAEVVTYLASDHFSFITGVNYSLDNYRLAFSGEIF